MSILEEAQLLAFREELSKVAAVSFGTLGRKVLGAERGAASLASSIKAAPGNVANFGKRQLHGVSGWTPKAGIGSIGMDAGAKHTGLTNLPDYVKGMANDPKRYLKRDVSNSWHSGGRVSKALMVGLPAMGVAHDIATPEQATGPGKGERIGRGLAGAAGGMLGSSMPLSGQLLLGGAMSHVGGTIGKGVDRLRGRKPGTPPPPTAGQPIQPDQQSGSHVPTERVMSNAAMGQPPEGASA